MRATLSNYKQAPRKVRLVADLVRGMPVDAAVVTLSHTNKRAAPAVRKLILSAVANAKENQKMEKDSLFIKSIEVNEGLTLKRFRPVWRNIAHPIMRKRSHVDVELGVRAQAPAKETKKEKK